jgi:O-antigen/teichoic acid export membrane protein
MFPLAQRILGRLSSGGPLSRLARGAFWSSASNAVTLMIGVAATIVAARILGSTGFGQLSMLRSTVETATVVAGMGLGVTANRYVALYRERAPEAAGEVIGVSIRLAWTAAVLVAGGMATFADALADVLHDPALAQPLRVAAGLVLFTTVTAANSGVLLGFEAFKSQAYVSATVAVLSAPLLVVGSLLGGIIGAVTGLALAAGVGLFLAVKTVNSVAGMSGIQPRFAWNEEQKRTLREFTIPAVLASLMVVPVFWAGNVMLSTSPGGYQEVGVFAAANQWRQAVLLLPNILTSASLPILSNLIGAGDGNSFRRMLCTNVGLVLAATVPVSVVLAALAPRILTLYGSTFVQGADTFALLLLSAVLFAVANAFGQVIASAGRMWLAMGLNACWAVVFLVLAWALCGRYGALGLAAAYAVSYTSHLALSAVVIRFLLSSLGDAAAVPTIDKKA